MATIFFVFLCQALSKTPCSSLYLQQLYRPIIILIQTTQANHNAGSVRIQLQKEDRTFGIKDLVLFNDFLGNSSLFCARVLPILQVGVKPGQLVAVHQVLGVAEVWQWISVVAQVGQSVSMVVGTLHHGVQEGVLAVGGRVGPVGSIWKRN